MGVDSGLPDFRGNEGFWRAYPPYQRLGLDFVSLANPRWFAEDATLAWGFYGHRMGLYRQTTPHRGFLDSCEAGLPGCTGGSFVFTSNVDGQFQRAGFAPERIVEVHGSFDGMQCTRDCGVGIFPGEPITVEIDPRDDAGSSSLAKLSPVRGARRPNILMFGDFGWDSDADRWPDAPDEVMARLARWREAGRHRVRGRPGGPDGPHDLPEHRPGVRRYSGPHQYPRAGGPRRPCLAFAGCAGGAEALELRLGEAADQRM